jgi:hypothetical protein
VRGPRRGREEEDHAPRALTRDNARVRHERHYTLEEARSLLPWVARAIAAMRDARTRLTDSETREALAGAAPGNGGGAHGRTVGEAFVELQAGVAAFNEREIVLRDLDRGLIDFPALRDGAEVYLCWIDGEADVEFWHELDAGYAGRRPL